MTDTLAPDTPVTDAAQLVDPQAVADLMAALERVFRIGVYYPSGHVMCDRAADHFLSSLRRTLGKAPALRFTLAGGVLHLQDVPLDPELRGVAGFRDLLALLGISGAVIDSNVSADELHRFVTLLLHHRNQVKGAHRFQQVQIEGLPPTIAVEHLEFTAREVDPDEVAEGGGDVRNPTVESLLTDLARHGLGAEDLERCRRLLEAIPDYLKRQGPDGAALPQVSWEDVELLLVRAARSVAGTPASPGDPGSAPAGIGRAGLDALTAIFQALGERADAENPREAIDLLLTLSRRSAPSAPEDGGPTRPQPARSAEAECVPVATLRAALDGCAARAGGPVTLQGGSRSEELSILMQMLGTDQKLPVQVRLQKRIRDIVRTGLAPDEWAIAAAGIRTLADPEAEERLFGPLVVLTDALRASGEASVLAFLRDVCAPCAPAQHGMFWPFLVNEILLEGRRRDPQAFADVCTLAGALDEQAMQDRLPRLESLPALRERRCAPGAFTPPPPELHRVFALVLGSAHAEMVGERLLDGLRHNPPNWLAEAVIPLMTRYQHKYRRFLIEVLRLRDEEEPGRTLLEAAGRIAADHLPALTFRDGDQEWLPRTLRALAALSVAGGEEILRTIVDQRRWFIIHAWPETCRQAARDTLASWRQRARTAPSPSAPATEASP